MARFELHAFARRFALWMAVGFLAVGCAHSPEDEARSPALAHGGGEGFEDMTRQNGGRLFSEGRETFRFDTFGDEDFWGTRLKLQQAIAGERQGGVGPGLTARQALQLGLKVDEEKLPAAVVAAIRRRTIDLDTPQTTLELLRADAVVGLKGFFDLRRKRLLAVGITCAFCHSTVDDGLTRGIGKRLDGWPNRDLNVGAIVALAPDLSYFEQLLGVDRAAVVAVLKSWGPGKYDAELNLDGKAMRPDGKPAATLLPAAFGLAGMNLHTYTGWGSVPYWNAFVAITQMHGKGTLFDPRLLDARKFPLAVKSGLADIRAAPDLVTGKLAGLQFYQLSLPAPPAPAGSYDRVAAARGRVLFEGKARCATCHVPPLYSEPGYAVHTGREIGIDDFQSARSPTNAYRTTPLRGLFARAKGGFYHDGRFADFRQVVEHYNQHFRLELSEAEKRDLIEYLKQL